ncbi:acetyltransferase [Kordiimonas sediminis]|uniref:Acetyltransferase n=1 Tax=Kordiimonas sediminis TaxID=1735581 RepID=A0A919AX34_9PROT|nr:GNAT family N-acetyltransferase [Kordiimonas sediminis]GHF29930.1 acetyltransferase [Kordiimonas sediminis]
MTANPAFVCQLATKHDIQELKALMAVAIDVLLADLLDPAQVEASKAVMGLDTQLIADGTYFKVLDGDRIVGSGGWSNRATLYGGDHTSGRNARFLDPASEPARIRAMYTDPSYTRCGIGSMIIDHCEAAALKKGFKSFSLMSTISGLPLYKARGYVVISEEPETVGTVSVPLFRMEKSAP